MRHFSCWYCDGARTPCKCTQDCGARKDNNIGGHVCGQAPGGVIASWLRGHGYSEEDIRRRLKIARPEDE